MRNNYLAREKYCDENSVYIVGPDGDDGLSGVLTFKLFNYMYQNNDIWVAWCQHIRTLKGELGACQSFSEKSLLEKTIRKSKTFESSHLKSFYTKLWKQVKYEDLFYKDNEMFKAAQDLAMIFPIVEMSGLRNKYIP